MSGLPCFYVPETAQHNPRFWINRGNVLDSKELPERAHRLLSALDGVGLSPQNPPETARAAMYETHTERYLQFLETAWAQWQNLPGAGAEVVANVHPQKQSQQYPASMVGRAGWHMSVTTEGFEQAAKLIAAAGLPTVLVQEGGYLSEDLTTNAQAFLGSWLAANEAKDKSV